MDLLPFLPGVATLSLLLLVTLPFLTGVPSFELNDPFREDDGFSVKLDTAIDLRLDLETTGVVATGVASDLRDDLAFLVGSGSKAREASLVEEDGRFLVGAAAGGVGSLAAAAGTVKGIPLERRIR